MKYKKLTFFLYNINSKRISIHLLSDWMIYSGQIILIKYLEGSW